MRFSLLFVNLFLLLATLCASGAETNLDSIITKNISGVNLSKEISLTDNVGNVLSKEVYYWDNVLSNWAGISRYDYAYNDSNLQIQYISFKWELSAKVWMNDTKFEYEYNEDGKRLLYAVFKWVNESWIASLKHQYNYDALGNQILDIALNWSVADSSWLNSSKIESEFDDKSMLLNAASFSWDMDASEWVAIEKYKTVSTYNSKGLPTKIVKSRWDKSSDLWVNVSMNTSSYNSYGNLTTVKIYYWNKTDNKWENNLLNTFTYDDNNNETLNKRYEWNGSTGNWSIVYEYYHTYDANNNITMFAHYEAVSGVYIGIEKNEMSYSDTNVCLEVTTYKWNLSSRSWSLAYKYNCNSAGNTKLFEYTSQWDEIAKAWNNISIGYYYSSITALDEEVITPELIDITLFPNPTTEGFSVSNITDACRLSVYTMSGNLVVSKTISEDNYTSLQNVSAGTYIVQVEDEGNIVTLKVVKQ